MSKLNLNKNITRGNDCSSNQDEEDIIEKKCTPTTPAKTMIHTVYLCSNNDLL